MNRTMHPRGYLLIELMMTTAIFLVVAALAGQVIYRGMRHAGSLSTQVNAADRLNHCLDVLRRDIWTASTVQVDAGELLVESADEWLAWRVTDTGIERQAADGTLLAWTELPALVAWRSDGVYVAVDLSSTGAVGPSAQTIWLPMLSAWSRWEVP